MRFMLKDLTAYKDIVIQCHDNPDPDALASGYAVWWYLKRKGINARLIYGGVSAIQKANVLKMIDILQIPVNFVTELEKPELLVTVDCQYGESNVTSFEAGEVAVIDHHRICGELPERSDVRSSYGSCSTVIYQLLKYEGISVNADEKLATALYYGLMTDTDNFASISHPADKDLRDEAKYLPMDILYFRNSNISKDELRIAGDALKQAFFNDRYHYGIIETKPCDPNILGIISDMLLEVDGVDTCLVYNIFTYGVKISVRSCTRETKASELASYLAGDLGGGGGHLVKAGGFLQRDLIVKSGMEYKKDIIERYLMERMYSYHKESEIITAGKYEEDLSHYEKYVKIETPMGFVRAKDLAECGTKIMIRTMEGDVDVEVEDDLYILLGIDGEIYPCKQEKFEASYRYVDGDYEFPGEYPPMVIDILTGDRIPLIPHAKCCIAAGGAMIYARELDHRVKVFTSWDPEKYYLGVEGDFLARRPDDLSDIYIVARQVFFRTYVKEGIS